MKTGFLAHKAAKPRETSQHSVITPQNSAPAPAAGAQSTGSLPCPAEPQAQQDTSWHQCLQLLGSDVDEKKFVGLLLVTKILPQGSDQAIRDVLDAVGLSFIQRLLLPLQHGSSTADAAKLPQQQLSVVLGLSILSVVCRLEQVRSSDDVLQLLPLLLKVGAAGGVAPVLQQQYSGQRAAEIHHAAADDWTDTAADAAAAADALECVLACAASGTYQRTVALESNAFPLTVEALQVAMTALSQAASGKPSTADTAATATATGAEASTAAAAASRMQCVLLAVQLLGRLLDQPKAAAGVAVQHSQATAAAVMLLSRVFGGLSTHVTSASTAQQRRSGVDAAVLQLEAQHTLLLLLPLLDDCEAAHLLGQSAAADSQQQQQPAAYRETQPSQQVQGSPSAAAAAAVAGVWPAALRHGLCQLLCSRTGVVQRHSALQLAAATVDLLGGTWLLPAGQQQQQMQQLGFSAVGTQSPGQFLLVLTEVLCIETPLLLSDAMNPGAVVPRADVSMAARQTTELGHAHQGDQLQAAPAAGGMVVDSDECGPGAAESIEEQQPLSVQQILQQVQQQEAQAISSDNYHGHQAGSSGAGVQGPPGFQVLTPEQQRATKSLQQRLAELNLPDDKPPGPQQQAAGARADQLLPACFLLLECCCEVLVTQAALLEHTAESGQHTAEQQADTAGAAAGGVPVLGMKEVQQLMMRLQQVTQVLLEFLEVATSPAPNAHLVNPLLTTGAVRVLGRFLADAPDVHQQAVQRLLPRLLTVAVPGDPLASGVSFLLPALLSWTSSGSSQQQWAAVLLEANGKCLGALAEHVSHLAAAAVAAAENKDSSSSLAQLTSLEARLGMACRVLQQLLGSLPLALAQEHLAQQQPQRHHGVGPVGLSNVHLKVLATLVGKLQAWESLRWQQQLQEQQQLGCRASAIAEAAAVCSLQALLYVRLELPVLMSVAALCGQLLTLMAAHTTENAADRVAAAAEQPLTEPETADAAGRMLCWGCEVGLSYQLLQVWWEHRQQQGRVSLQQDAPIPDYAADVLAEISPVWEDAELGELWDVCLSAAAELLLVGFPAGLSDTLGSAAWVATVVQAHAPQTVAAVTSSSPELQLLRSALSARCLE